MLLSLLAMTTIFAPSRATAVGEEKSNLPEIAVFASAKGKESLDLLAESFTPIPVVKHPSIRAAIANPSRILILLGPGAAPKRSSTEFSTQEADLSKLRHRRVVAVGAVASMVFRRLGLRISADECSRGTHGPPRIRVGPNGLIDQSRWPEPLLLLEPPDPPRNPDLVFGRFSPGDHPDSAPTESVAFFTAGGDACLTRQGRHLLVGLDAPVRMWSKPLRGLFREVVLALKDRPEAAFDLDPGHFCREVVGPVGRLTFTLPGRGEIGKKVPLVVSFTNLSSGPLPGKRDFRPLIHLTDEARSPIPMSPEGKNVIDAVVRAVAAKPVQPGETWSHTFDLSSLFDLTEPGGRVVHLGLVGLAPRSLWIGIEPDAAERAKQAEKFMERVEAMRRKWSEAEHLRLRMNSGSCEADIWMERPNRVAMEIRQSVYAYRGAGMVPTGEIRKFRLVSDGKKTWELDVASGRYVVSEFRRRNGVRCRLADIWLEEIPRLGPPEYWDHLFHTTDFGRCRVLKEQHRGLPVLALPQEEGVSHSELRLALDERGDPRFVMEVRGFRPDGAPFGPNWSFDDLDFESRPPRRTFRFKPPRGAREVTPAAIDLPELGAEVSEFELRDVTGNKCRLSELVEKQRPMPVLILFWRSDSTYRMSDIQGLYEDQEDRGFRVLGIACGVTREKAVAAAAKAGVSFRILLDQAGGGSVATRLGVRKFPTMMLVNSKRELLWHNHGSGTAERGDFKTLAKLVRKSPRARMR